MFLQGHDEEAVVDMGKISSTINTNFEKEELESKFVVVFCLLNMHFLSRDKRWIFLSKRNQNFMAIMKFWVKLVKGRGDLPCYLSLCMLVNIHCSSLSPKEKKKLLKFPRKACFLDLGLKKLLLLVSNFPAWMMSSSAELKVRKQGSWGRCLFSFLKVKYPCDCGHALQILRVWTDIQLPFWFHSKLYIPQSAVSKALW